MTLSDDVDLEEYIMAKDELSGADIKAVCTEAGLLALRERRMRVTKVDFTAAREKVSALLIAIRCVPTALYRFFTGRTRVYQKDCTYDSVVNETCLPCIDSSPEMAEHVISI